MCSELSAYYADFGRGVSSGELCEGTACRGWFLSQVDTWHACSCPAGRSRHPEDDSAADDACLESDRLDTLPVGPYAPPALPVDDTDDLPF